MKVSDEDAFIVSNCIFGLSHHLNCNTMKSQWFPTRILLSSSGTLLIRVYYSVYISSCAHRITIIAIVVFCREKKLVKVDIGHKHAAFQSVIKCNSFIIVCICVVSCQ